jgi:NADH-quinone oxidoreductase subunit L
VLKSPFLYGFPTLWAGPTPVSALIHAATMVTAGVYMIARLGFLFIQAPNVLLVIMLIGTVTALFAASIALVQNDIKKVLAYSTISQLGYMFMAMGAGAFSHGVFHVVTHAFFKACLFLCAGSVILGCHHEQDMRKFGGLRKKMPLTFLTYLVSTLAIAGAPFLSGFYSKDAILWTVFSSTGLASEINLFSNISLSEICWGLGLFTAFLTAFYMTRSLMLTFFGKYRGHAEPHESSWIVITPLIILAGLSAIFGLNFGVML